MPRKKIVVGRLLLGCVLFASLVVRAQEIVPDANAATAASVAPYVVVNEALTGMQAELSGKRKYYADNPRTLYELMDNTLVRSFDVHYAGKLVLGKTHWTSATQEQRERFIEAFYSFLIRTYAKAVLEFKTSDLIISPEVSYSKDNDKALVRTELVVPGSDNAQVNYSVRLVDGVWKIYDVRVEGVSYIQNYRSQFNAEISAQGLEAVILRLEDEVRAADMSSELKEQPAI